MSKFKVGDIVIVDDNKFNRKDERIIIGSIRKVILASMDGHVLLDKELSDRFEKGFFYANERFKKLEDNAMNRLLYPEAFNE